jgi:hypothetical protein
MSNQNQVTGKIPALRTYAQDLENTRQAKNLLPKVVAVSDSPIKTQINIPKAVPKPNTTPPVATLKRVPEKGLIDVTKELNDLGTKIIVDNEDAAIATVITDTKRDRFKLFPAIINSLNNWLSNQKSERRRKAIPKYTIPQTTRRQGVIQKATSNTGKAATADFHNLQERIKQRTEEVIEETEGKTIWTPDTEPGYLLLEETNFSPVTNVTIEPRKSYYTEMARLEAEENEMSEEESERSDEDEDTTNVWENSETTETSAEELSSETDVPTWETPVTTPEPIKTETTRPSVATVTAPVVEATPTPDEPIAAPVVSPVVETKTRLIPPKPKLQDKSSFWYQLQHLNTNTLALIISAFILVVVVGVIVIQIFLNQEKAALPAIPPTPESLLLNTNLNLIINGSNNGSDLTVALNNLKPMGPEIIQAVIMDSAPTNNPTSPVTVLNLLDSTIEKNLAQSISVLRFGYTSEQQPFILMKVSSTVVAQGGMLLWEKNLYNDLAKIFTLDPIPQSSNLNFSDSTFAGRDVRLIKQPSGSEMLIYGLINNTVIITTTSSSYRELSILIK